MEFGAVYIGLMYPELDETEFDRIVRRIEDEAVNTARLIFSSGFELKVVVEEGSLKNKIAIGGTVASLYAAIANYPDFESGIVLMAHRAEQFTDAVSSKIKQVLHAKPEQVIYEKRSFRDLKRLENAIDALNAAKKANTPQERKKLVNDAVANLARLYRGTSEDEFKKLMLMLPTKDLPELPQSPAALLMQDRRQRRPGAPRSTPSPEQAKKAKPRLKYQNTIPL